MRDFNRRRDRKITEKQATRRVARTTWTNLADRKFKVVACTYSMYCEVVGFCGCSFPDKESFMVILQGGLHPRVAEVKDSRMLVVSGASPVAEIIDASLGWDDSLTAVREARMTRLKWPVGSRRLAICEDLLLGIVRESKRGTTYKLLVKKHNICIWSRGFAYTLMSPSC